MENFVLEVISICVVPIFPPVLIVHIEKSCDNLPPRAVLLATSKPCPVQMFRVKNNIYATQFHPEADAKEFILRIKTYKHHGYFPAEQAEELIASIQNLKTPTPTKILKRFVQEYKK